jgi:hypothetical protein
MKTCNRFFLLILLSVFAVSVLHAQSSTFSVQSYKEFLSTHQNMTSAQLMQMHDAGLFKANIVSEWDSALFKDSIASKYNLTDHEITLLRNHGFMVSERLTSESFGNAFLEIFHNDLPVFISTDAILHALHFSYNRILKDVELGFIIPRLGTMLTNLRANMSQLEARYASEPDMMQPLKDVDVYFTIAAKLLGQNVNPYFSSNAIIVNELMALIESEQLDQYDLFSSVCRLIDFSQFTPRAHYTDPYQPQLAKYFKAMMWLGRIEVYLSTPRALSGPCPMPAPADIQRQTIDAFLIKELFEFANVNPIYDEIETILKFFVGDPDNVTINNLDYLADAIQLTFASELLDTVKLKAFQDTLKNQSFAYQRILSQVLISTDADSIIPASAFLFFGQRFIIDSYVFSHVVYDRINHNGYLIKRMLPNSLDALFALGNDAAAQLLINDLNQYHYSTNLAGVRYLIDSYDNSYWEVTIYNMWLNSVRKLNPPEARDNLPYFMQTAAFWQQKMNTQLASWTQLRHDNLLYGKQSYSGGYVCSYPYSYVEPFPDFYSTLKLLAANSATRFQALTFFEPYLRENVVSYFNSFAGIMDTLSQITLKELNGIELNINEINFLRNMILKTGIHCGALLPYEGWYPRLFYNDDAGLDGLLMKDLLVADVHTAPTDEGGSFVGWVKHVGTGNINMGVWVAGLHDNTPVAFIGPVLSYHEYTSTNFKRLTDEEWGSVYLNASLRPAFTNIYLADSLGNAKPTGSNLLTSVRDDLMPGAGTPEDFLILNNYPNPFNATTLINFSIPPGLTGSKVSINIYNIQGKLVKKLIDTELPAGNYLHRWDGKDDSGLQTSSGVYIYTLNVNENILSKKMMQLK